MSLPSDRLKQFENSQQALQDLYDQGRGLVTFTHDQIFKKLMLDCPEFLHLLLDTFLPLPSGSITSIKHQRTEIPSAGKKKGYRLDLLVRIELSPRCGKPSSHLVNIEMYHST